MFGQITYLLESAYVVRFLSVYLILKFAFEFWMRHECLERIWMSDPMEKRIIGHVRVVAQFTFHTGFTHRFGIAIRRQIKSENIVEQVKVFERLQSVCLTP